MLDFWAYYVPLIRTENPISELLGCGRPQVSFLCLVKSFLFQCFWLRAVEFVQGVSVAVKKQVII